MVDLSQLEGVEQIKKVNETKAIKYKVEKEEIDIGALEIEKRGIEEQLSKILTDEELLEWARQNYPYQNIDEAKLRARLAEINSILENL